MITYIQIRKRFCKVLWKEKTKIFAWKLIILRIWGNWLGQLFKVFFHCREEIRKDDIDLLFTFMKNKYQKYDGSSSSSSSWIFPNFAGWRCLFFRNKVNLRSTSLFFYINSSIVTFADIYASNYFSSFKCIWLPECFTEKLWCLILFFTVWPYLSTVFLPWFGITFIVFLSNYIDCLLSWTKLLLVIGLFF